MAVGRRPAAFAPDVDALADEQLPRHFIDLADVRAGHARRAPEAAAAGGHNLLLMARPAPALARRLPTLLPALSLGEAMVTTRIHSAAGRLPQGRALLMERPFRAPHHTISDAGLIGGGVRAQPGEISLAHQGVLFLDELPEFRRHVLEALRQPLEEGQVTVTRAMATVNFPAAALVVAAMNPCPCGYHGHPRREYLHPPQIQSYRAPHLRSLLDRFDIQMAVPALGSMS
jgi:magnesium chelatase family protein